MIENSVVSLPPCCVAVETNAPPILPCSAPFAHNPPAWSRKLAIRDGMRPKRGPHDDGIVVDQVFHFRDRRLLIEFEVRRFCHFFGHQLGNALDGNQSARRARALRAGLGPLFDVTVSRMLENENSCHDHLPLG